MTSPRSAVFLDQPMTYSEFFLKPENLDLASPTLMPTFAGLGIFDSNAETGLKGLGLTFVSPRTTIDIAGEDADEPAEYFREPHIDEDEPEEYFRPAYIDDDEPAEYFRLAYINEDEPEEYFRPPYFEDSINHEPEELSRETFTETDPDQKLESVHTWLNTLQSPLQTLQPTPPPQRGTPAPSLKHLRSLSIL